MAVKPTSKIDWTVGNPSFGTVTQEPTAGEKQTGWSPSQRPPSQWMNWLFWNILQWINYFEIVTDQAANLQYDAIVATTGGTHTDLASAIAAVNPNARIYVKNDLTITAPVQVTKNGLRIEFAPGATIIKGGSAGSGIQISANDVRIENGRFSGFSGGGEEGILIDATSLRSRILNCNFASCAAAVNDQEAATGIQTGIIEE